MIKLGEIRKIVTHYVINMIKCIWQKRHASGLFATFCHKPKFIKYDLIRKKHSYHRCNFLRNNNLCKIKISNLCYVCNSRWKRQKIKPIIKGDKVICAICSEQ